LMSIYAKILDLELILLIITVHQKELVFEHIIRVQLLFNKLVIKIIVENLDTIRNISIPIIMFNKTYETKFISL
jgi:hypothetical protein